MPGYPVFAQGDTALMLRDVPFPYRVAYGAMEYCFDAYADWSSRHDVPIKVIAIPMRYQAVEQDRAATFDLGYLDGAMFDIDQPTRFLAETSERFGFPFIDLREAFVPHGDDTWRLYIPNGDIHWNERGNAVVADFLVEPMANWIRSAMESE